MQKMPRIRLRSLSDFELPYVSDELQLIENQEFVAAGLAKLSKRQRRITRLRFGFQGKSRTLKEIALKLGVSTTKVFRVLEDVKAILRTQLEPP
jgi:DNA-directed RNA polymerase specialized sigma subunit